MTTPVTDPATTSTPASAVQVLPAPVSVPASVDASVRALRTAAQGLAVDVATAVVLAAAAGMGEIHWTRAYWLALGGLLAKTAITAAVSYAARRLLPPKTS